MRICIVPEYPASLMTGGLQVQADETYRALAALNRELTAELFNWSVRSPLADLYHFIGFPPHLHHLTGLIREVGRPYVLTILFGGSRQPMKLRLALVRRLIKSQVLRRSERYNSVKNAAAIITITEADAEAARFIYGLDPAQIHVVRHGINESFFRASPEVWRCEFGEHPFVLCVGAIQPRKNQLLLVEACNQLRLPVVLLGPVLPGEQAYADLVAAAAKANQAFGGRWLQHLRNEDPLLVSAYGACRLFALLSTAETQPLSVMQAMAARKSILLLRSDYAREAPFAQLTIIGTENLHAVRQALQQEWENGKPTELARDFTWHEVAQELHKIYQEVLAKK